MIGVSLSLKFLGTGISLDQRPEELLPLLYAQGVRSIEIRSANPGTDPEVVRTISERLWDYGFQVTVHCRVKNPETPIQDVFDALLPTLAHMRQESLTVTIHPIQGDNVRMLQQLSDYATENNYPVMIALENNRLLPDGTEGDSTALVLEAVEQADRPNVGICFDMGHYTYYLKKNCPDELDKLPSRAFFRRVIHTHIHAVNGLTTHFPLDQFELRLKEILHKQAVAYYGVHNIELGFPRFKGIREPSDALIGSVKALQAALPQRTRIYDDIREHYDGYFLKAVQMLGNQKNGTQMCLTQCASYLFNTNGLPWAMDLSFLVKLWKLTKTPYCLEYLMRDLKLIVVSHQHGDHFSRRTVHALKANQGITWIIPDFLVERALDYGVVREQMIVISAGETVSFGGLTVRAFEGRHYRPVTLDGVPCMGYHISAENAPSLVFPGDVRDYSAEGLPELPEADYCFAHVWLGDGKEFDDEFPLAEDFSRFMLHFSRKNLILSHLNNAERKNGYMWTERHAWILAEKIRELSPETRTMIPHWGQVIQL